MKANMKPERNSELVAAYRGGATLRQCAKTFGIAVSRAHAIVHATNEVVHVRPPGRSLSVYDDNRSRGMVEMYRNGVGMKLIAKQFQTSTSMVHKVIHRRAPWLVRDPGHRGRAQARLLSL